MMTKFQITMALKNGDIDQFIDKKELVCSIYDIDSNISDEDYIFILKNICIDKRIVKFIKTVGKHFKYENYLKYKEYRKSNKYDINSNTVLEIMYGTLNEEIITKHRRRKSIYDAAYVSKKYGFSLEESREWITEYKKNKSTSLAGFIQRHGDEKGRILFQKFQETSKTSNSPEKFQKLYGDKWQEIRKKFNKKNSHFCVDYWIEKKQLSYDEAIKKVIETQKNKSGVSIDYYLNKGFTQEQAENILLEINNKKGLDKEKFIQRYGEEKWNSFIERKTSFIKKNKKVGRYASKASMKVLLPLYKWIRKKGIEKEFIKIGTSKRVEWTIRDVTNDKLYFYDFVDLKNKIIIEYNGEHVHPNIEKLTKQGKIEKWKHYFNGRGALEMKAIYEKKYQIARENGFTVYEIWSSTKPKANLQKCKKIYEEILK